jgi:spermidine/putrescine transport system ATP-binding protein
VLNPRVLLLDEPLGALDAQLRKQLQLELRALQREVGITFVYVTHDQEEALTMSDRIAVLAEGRVEQVGEPAQIYAMPATTYVAGFLGSANIFDAEVLTVDSGGASCAALGSTVGASADPGLRPGPAAVVIRPERIALLGADEPVAEGRNVLRGTVRDVVYLGAATRVHVELPGAEVLTVEVANHDGPSSMTHPPGSTVQCVCRPDAVRVLRRSPVASPVDPAAA